jgi:hypothetical protein
LVYNNHSPCRVHPYVRGCCVVVVNLTFSLLYYV